MNPILSVFDYYTLTNKKDILISYKGPVTDVIMAEISRDIRSKVSENQSAGRRVFAVFIELAQNILFYSAEKINFGDRNDSVGILLLSEKENEYIFSCGNLVENDYMQELIESCDKINQLDRDDLRKFKREIRNKPQGERSKGAGIGLIHVAITSRNPLDVEYRQLDEEFSFFALTVKIAK